MTIDKRRRAVFTVLSEVLSDQTLWEVMWHWQNHYSEKPQFELNHFLADCNNVPEIAENRSWLYRQLIGLLMNKSSELKPDPWEDMRSYEIASGYISADYSDLPDWSLVFSSVINTLEIQLRSDNQRTVYRYVIDNLERKKCSPALVTAFKQWTREGNLIDVKTIEKHELKTLINLFYVAMCELLGPVKGDKILSTAIQETHFKLGINELDARTLL